MRVDSPPGGIPTRRGDKAERRRDRYLSERIRAAEEVDVLRYLALLGQIGSRIARMLKAREALGGDSDLLSELFDEALDLLNGQVEVDV